MKTTKLLSLCMALVAATQSALSQVPENLVVEGVLPHSAELKAEAGRYLEFRAAGFSS